MMVLVVNGRSRDLYLLIFSLASIIWGWKRGWGPFLGPALGPERKEEMSLYELPPTFLVYTQGR